MDLLNIVHRFLISLGQRFVFDNTCIYKPYLTKKKIIIERMIAYSIKVLR